VVPTYKLSFGEELLKVIIHLNKRILREGQVGASLSSEVCREKPFYQDKLLLRAGVYVPAACQTTANLVFQVDAAVLGQLRKDSRGDED
jgi:hypothetical protein